MSQIKLSILSLPEAGDRRPCASTRAIYKRGMYVCPCQISLDLIVMYKLILNVMFYIIARISCCYYIIAIIAFCHQYSSFLSFYYHCLFVKVVILLLYIIIIEIFFPAVCYCHAHEVCYPPCHYNGSSKIFNVAIIVISDSKPVQQFSYT